MMVDIGLIKEILQSDRKNKEMFADQVKQFEEEEKNMKQKTPLDKTNHKFEENSKRLKPTNFLETAFERSKARREQRTCQLIFDLEEYSTWRTADENDILGTTGVG